MVADWPSENGHYIYSMVDIYEQVASGSNGNRMDLESISLPIVITT